MSPPRRATIISPQFQPSSISKVVPRKTSTSTSASIDDDDDDDDDDEDGGARSDSYSGSASDGAGKKEKVRVPEFVSVVVIGILRNEKNITLKRPKGRKKREKLSKIV